MDNDWRCMCGQENHPTKIKCRKCLKQRWSQLGFTLIEALGIAAAFFDGGHGGPIWPKIQ